VVTARVDDVHACVRYSGVDETTKTIMVVRRDFLDWKFILIVGA